MRQEPLDIGVVPASALDTERRLFSALEEVLPVRFRPSGSDRDAAAHVVFDDGGTRVQHRSLGAAPVLRYVGSRRDRPAADGRVHFANTPALDYRLRGRTLLESHAEVTDLPDSDGCVLACDARSRPVWIKRSIGSVEVDEVAIAPPNLGPGQALRDQLVPGRFIALLPLIHFLRGVAAARGVKPWNPPPLRATFVVDDPNLHWRSYGNLRYASLAEHASEIGYHIGMATIPLDAWYTYPPAARLFAARADRLSLAIHGNDHTGPELGRPRSEADAAALLSQALRRVDRLESRTGLRVSRVMVPPHEACTETILRVLMRLGYDAATMTRSHPWISLADQKSPYATNPDDLTAGWFPAEVREDGFPILLRRGFFEADEVVLRAYLDQPLIFYGHITDLVDGLTPLENLAGAINSFGGVRWCSLGEIAATNFLTRQDDGRLIISPFSRKFHLDTLAGVSEVVIRWLRAYDASVRVEWRLRNGAKQTSILSDLACPLAVPPGAREAEVQLVSRRAVDYRRLVPPRPSPKAILRRVLTEGRDRALPAVSSVKRRLR